MDLTAAVTGLGLVAGRPPIIAPEAVEEAPAAAAVLDRLRHLPWLEALSDGWLRLVALVAILLVALVLAVFLDRLLSRWIRGLTRRTRTDFDDRLVDILHRPVRNTVMIVALALATQVLGLGGRVETWTLAALKTLAVLVWAGFGFRFASLLLAALSNRRDQLRMVNTRTLPLFDNLAKVVLAGAAVYFVLLSWRIDVTAWLASAGIIGIAVGFAAKDTLANLFSGVFISADAPYQVGDFVVLDSGERGRVVQVGIRSTRLLTRDDVEITIPNAVIANAKIVNESGGPWTKERVRVKVQAAYGSDIDRVRETLMAAATSVDHVCSEPEPRVRFRSFGDSGLDFELLCWIDEPVLRGRVLDALHGAVYKGFAAAGVEIPFPQRDVWVRSPPAPAQTAGSDPDPSPDPSSGTE